MAGNIIPAIATTNAVIAGLIVMEAMKILCNSEHLCRTVSNNTVCMAVCIGWDCYEHWLEQLCLLASTAVYVGWHFCVRWLEQLCLLASSTLYIGWHCCVHWLEQLCTLARTAVFIG